MNEESTRVYRLLGNIFFWTGIGILALFTFISVYAGFLMFFVGAMTGIPFALIGAGFLLAVKKKEKMVNELIQWGHTVEAVVTDIYQDTSITVNGRHPWMVEAVWDDPETLSVHTFTCHTDEYRPSRRVIGGTVTVYVDPLDFKRYAVDLDTLELPQEEEEDLQALLGGQSAYSRGANGYLPERKY